MTRLDGDSILIDFSHRSSTISNSASICKYFYKYYANLCKTI